MAQKDQIQLFEDKRIRTAWDEEKEEWYFSVVDVISYGSLLTRPDCHRSPPAWSPAVPHSVRRSCIC